MAAVSVTHLPRVTSKLGVSRALQVPWPLGQAFGPAGDARTHRAVALAALNLLQESSGTALLRPFAPDGE